MSAYLLHDGRDYRAAGVSVYTRQLLLHLPKAAPEHAYVAFHGKDASELPGVQSCVSQLPTRRPTIRIAWEQIALPVQSRRAHVDVLHGTVNVIPWASGLPTVVTVHDLSFLRHPDRFVPAKAMYLRSAVSLSVARARCIIAVSEHTRNDLIDLLKVRGDRVTVVQPGVDDRFRTAAPAQGDEIRNTVFGGRPYILHVGTLEPRKNVDLLIKAFSHLRGKMGLPHVLALVGARGWMYDSLYRLVADLELEKHVRFVDYVPPSELPLWYTGADLFAYPSVYEGFGLPLAEAMASGVPAITSASSALMELADGACVTVEPGSQEALQEAMGRIMGDQDLRERLKLTGLERSRLLTWDRTARNTAAVYERAAGLV